MFDLDFEEGDYNGFAQGLEVELLRAFYHPIGEEDENGNMEQGSAWGRDTDGMRGLLFCHRRIAAG